MIRTSVYVDVFYACMCGLACVYPCVRTMFPHLKYCTAWINMSLCISVSGMSTILFLLIEPTVATETKMTGVSPENALILASASTIVLHKSIGRSAACFCFTFAFCKIRQESYNGCRVGGAEATVFALGL